MASEDAECNGPGIASLQRVSQSQQNLPSEAIAGIDSIQLRDTLDLSNSSMDLNTSVSVESSSAELSCIPWAQLNRDYRDFDDFIDSMGLQSTADLPSMFVDQPLISFADAPLFGASGASSFQKDCPAHDTSPVNPNRSKPSSPSLFDEFSSAFPSFESASAITSLNEPWSISQTDWSRIAGKMEPFKSLLAPEFQLPSRHTLTRYIVSYINGFHCHLPFLHIPTFSPTKCPIELLMAIAAVGAQYSFDGINAIKLFRSSRAICMERLRLRKVKLQDEAFTAFQPLNSLSLISHGIPRKVVQPSRANKDENFPWDPLPIAQSLLLLMAMSTWGDSKIFCNDSINLQSILTLFLREEKLLEYSSLQSPTWAQWIHEEGLKRTVGITFCFFNFHTIIYNTPPPILNSEFSFCLPSREVDWEAPTENEWQEARREALPEPGFQDIFSLLFSRKPTYQQYSSLGGYILILALIQHIYLLRELSNTRIGVNELLLPSDVKDVETALCNWQASWEKNPDSSLLPSSPAGPISFNSSALLRMAYIRLHVDVGHWRALSIGDPGSIAQNFRQSPRLKRTHNLTRTVLYSAHALSIPIKLGVNNVAHRQAFSWSLQHSLCALECAFVISKWLDVVLSGTSGTPLDDDEMRLLAYISDMVREAKSQYGQLNCEEDLECQKNLGYSVAQIWSKLLGGETVWAVVNMVAEILKAYCQLLQLDSASS